MTWGSRSLKEEDGWQEEENVVKCHRKGSEEEMKTWEVIAERRGRTRPWVVVNSARRSLCEVASSFPGAAEWGHSLVWENIAVQEELSLLDFASVRRRESLLVLRKRLFVGQDHPFILSNEPLDMLLPDKLETWGLDTPLTTRIWGTQANGKCFLEVVKLKPSENSLNAFQSSPGSCLPFCWHVPHVSRGECPSSFRPCLLPTCGGLGSRLFLEGTHWVSERRALGPLFETMTAFFWRCCLFQEIL